MSYPHTSPPRKIYEKDKEMLKIQSQRDELIRKFLKTYIYDESNALRPGNQLKTYSDSARYEGEMTPQGLKQGRGIYHYPNGDKYLGEWHADHFNGQGVYIFAMGERFEGELSNGKKHGKGIYYYLNGNIYRGDWANDKKNGQGEYIYNTTGESYEGEWKDGERNGIGKYLFCYGDRYEGMWLKGMKSGKGVLAT